MIELDQTAGRTVSDKQTRVVASYATLENSPTQVLAPDIDRL